MSWTRTDDGISFHAAISELSDRDYRMLTAGVWAYCSRERNGGVFHRSDFRHIRYDKGSQTYRLSASAMASFLRLGLIDETADDQGNAVYHVHNWERYQPVDPTAAERKRRSRAKQARDSHSDVTTVTDRDSHNRDSRARAFPSRPVTTEPKAVALDVDDEPDPIGPAPAGNGERPQDHESAGQHLPEGF